ncbi:hypothetical protein EVAR_39011_1 [Eumeta japonica]|uniref:Uncharacterized protein n=1 Tax=Eumeta variegata TaxID=151549 RepID=A0A4C1WN96_EUMVA|nr:hypothetical protein EVAR_39011_1 [Eumeta japonica]
MSESNRFGGSCVVHGSGEEGALGAAGPAAGAGPAGPPDDDALSPVPDPPPGFSHSACPPEVHRTCFCVRFIAEHTKMLEDSTKRLRSRERSKTRTCVYIDTVIGIKSETRIRIKNETGDIGSCLAFSAIKGK